MTICGTAARAEQSRQASLARGEKGLLLLCCLGPVLQNPLFLGTDRSSFSFFFVIDLF